MYIVMEANAIEKEIGVYYYLHGKSVMLEEHIHDGFHEIMIILRGTIEHWADGDMTLLSRGDLVYLPNDSVHKMDNPRHELLLLNLCMLPSTYEQGLSFLRVSTAPNRIIYNSVPQTFVDYLLWNHEQMLQKMNREERIILIRNTFSQLLPYCVDLRNPTDWFDALQAQMQKQEHFQQGVKRMQELAFCSPAHLSRTCKARLGMTPTQYINKLRIQYAENMLRHSKYSIQDICVECGYNNIGYFYRHFSDAVGMPPGVYQKMHSLEIKQFVEG